MLSVPLAIVLPMFFGVEGALYSAPIADIGSMIAVIVMSAIMLRELKEKEESPLQFVKAEEAA